MEVLWSIHRLLESALINAREKIPQIFDSKYRTYNYCTHKLSNIDYSITLNRKREDG